MEERLGDVGSCELAPLLAAAVTPTMSMPDLEHCSCSMSGIFAFLTLVLGGAKARATGRAIWHAVAARTES